MFIIDIAVSAAIGTLTGMGVGGGGLLVGYLTAVKGIGVKEARIINLLFFVVASFSALIYYARKRKTDGKTVLVLALSGIAGSYPGTLAAALMPEEVLGKVFGAFLLASSLYVALKSFRNKDDTPQKHRK